MSEISKSVLVPFTAKQMYELVNDIEQYPHFLPWCPKTEVLERTQESIKATVYFAKGALGKSFTTLNKLIPDERIEMRLVEGPFRTLEGVWHFETLPQCCRVSLHLSFEFSHKLLSLTIGPLFQQIANSMVSTFSSRAYTLYGQAHPAVVLP